MGTQSSRTGLVNFLRLILLISVLFGASACTSDGGGGASDGGTQPPTGNSPQVQPCARSNLPCASGTVCDPFAGCVQCVFDSDCASGQWCRANVCEAAVACTANADCASTAGAQPVCDLHRGVCAPCVQDPDCGPYAHCVADTCIPYQPCVNTFDCSGGLVCDRGSGECVACVGDGDCPDGTACLDHQCRAKCTSDNTCVPFNQLCHPIGVCVQCVADTDCPSVYHCDSGKCVSDVCQAGSVRCDPSTFGTFTCMSDGRSYIADVCQSGTSCDAANGAVCASWTCNPGLTTCDNVQNALIQCSSDGLVSTILQQCGAGEVCSSGACKKVICQASLPFCDTPTSVAVCSVDGTEGYNSQPCFTGQHCENGWCVANTCLPDSLTCAGNIVKTCDSVGASYLSNTTDCAATNRVCENGVCKDVVCTVNAKSCGSDGNVYLCNANGTSTSLYQTCTAGSVCDNSDGAGVRCRTVVCTPGAPLCDGDRLTACNAAGTGPNPTGGTDCTATGDVCYGGACLPVVCPTITACINGNVYTCINKGTDMTLAQTCTTAQYCSIFWGNASCSADVCTSGQMGCNGQIVGTCNSDGSGFDTSGQDCSSSNSVCVSGSCLPIICVANATYCQSGNVYKCGANGTTTALYSTCSSSYYCKTTSSTSAVCALDVCTAGTAVCNGNTATTCLPDGSGPDTSTGTDCAASGQACDAGQCKAIVCPAGQKFCNSGNVYNCNASGTASALYQTCTSAQYCNPTGGSAGQAVCSTDVCLQGQPACDGEILAVCAADGSGYASTSTDCSASGQVCNEAVACAASAVDVYGASTSSLGTAAAFYGDEYQSNVARTLTSIESYLTIPGTFVFTWVVYEGIAANGTYNLIFQKTTSASGTASFIGSGTISVPLQAGKYYVIGAFISGGTYTMFYQLGTAQKYLSFGRGLTGVTIAGTSPAATASPTTTTYTLYQRLTTAP